LSVSDKLDIIDNVKTNKKTRKKYATNIKSVSHQLHGS